MEDEDYSESDARFVWLQEKVLPVLKVREDKWQKLAEDETSRQTILTFLEVADIRTMIFYINERDELVASPEFPALMKKKAAVFLKKEEYSGVSADSINEALLWEDLSSSPLDQLHGVMNEVYMPLLENSKNRRGWPEVLTEDVMAQFHKFSGDLSHFLGKTKGETKLPMPPVQKQSVEAAARDRAIVHNLESAVVNWTRLVKRILEQESATQVRQMELSGSFPGTYTEITFWEERIKDLRNIEAQLSGEKIKKVFQVLALTESSYISGFQSLLRDFRVGLEEAEEVNSCLVPLSKYLNRMMQCSEFSEIKANFRPIIHIISLIWTSAPHYAKALRVINLFKLICNDLITASKQVLGDNSIMSDEPPEAMEKLISCLKTCANFKTVYFEYRNKINSENPKHQWCFDNDVIFSRLDLFLQRVKDVHDIIKSFMEYSKLEKVEVGGGRGGKLRGMIESVFNRFLELFAVFEECEFPILSVESEEFDKAFFDYCMEMKDLDRKLCSVIAQSFEECTTPIQAFKVLETFEPQVSRDLIRAQLADCYVRLEYMYDRDLDEVSEYIALHKSDPPVLNLPRVAGTLSWSKGIMDRIGWPMERFRALRPQFLESEEGVKIVEKYEQIVRVLEHFMQETFDEWAEKVDSVSVTKLDEPLLKRKMEFLGVNFDVELSDCMQEVKYLVTMDMGIPEKASDIYQEKETFRMHSGNLHLIVGQYNTIMRTLLPVERPLVESRIQNVDRVLSPGLVDITWRSPSVMDFINEARDVVKDLYGRMNFVKGNVKSMEKLMLGWLNIPHIITNREQKRATTAKAGRLVGVVTFWRSQRGEVDEEEEESGAPLPKQVFSRWRNKSVAEIKDTSDLVDQGHKIHKLMAASCRKLEVNRASEEWHNYVNYVNTVVRDGVFEAIRTALQYLISNMEAVQWNKSKLSKNPVVRLCDMKMDLVGNALVFSPDISGGSNSLQELVRGWVRQSFALSTYVNRLDIPEQDFSEEMEGCGPLTDLRSSVEDLLAETIKQCDQIRRQFLQFEELVSVDREEYLEKFLAGAVHRRVKEGTEENVDGPQYHPPLLEDFEEAVLKYEKLMEDIKSLPRSFSFGWINVDLGPAREALANAAQHWRFMFVNHLEQDVIQSLADLAKFCEETSAGLQQPVVRGSYESLTAVMSFMSQYRKRAEWTERMFGPLRDKTVLLKKFGRSLPEEIHEALDQAPDTWGRLSKLYFSTKENLSPLQSEQMTLIQRQEDVFSEKVSQYRTAFLTKAPNQFNIPMQEAYSTLDELNLEVRELERQLDELLEKQDLFELIPFSAQPLRECRSDIRMLKAVWDVVGLVEFQLNDWKSLIFLEVETEKLEDETKKIVKEIRALDKRVRSWNVYQGLEDRIKNFQVSLPLITLLRSPSMRPRHWNALMETTGVKFVLTSDFRLDDLMQLELHRFVADVETIVEQSSKENSMEKSLKELDEHWKNLQLEYVPHKDTQIKLIKVVEEVVETLETDQMLVQGMISSKFIGIFEEQVNEWVRKLGSVDAVLNIFLEVQRTWAYLENIFIGSEDIRAQLPEESKLFDGIDEDLKRILHRTAQIPNVLEACLQPSLEDTLSRLTEELDRCEKRLDEYLETKKKAFPRFYFMSVPDLLDVLSVGGQSPHDVMINIPKLFQAMKTLHFKEDESGKQTNIATGMYSREGEFVEFVEPMECVGQVENWLNALERTMKDAVRVRIGEAVQLYEELSREKWLEAPCAQAVLTTSQIFWTTEVFQAFESMEEGNENAMKEYNKKQIEQLNQLIYLVQGELDRGLRQKVMSLVTLDVHARDIVQGLIRDKIDNGQAFAWQSQLRVRWDDREKQCHINICDAHFVYGYEYLGNGPRLVITPLTDRIYITLTQSLHLIMGGAPAGPAGTGKTETTKDLASQLGKPVYVFNCSDQMDYRSLGNIFKGLASSGSWGCFDEFNRIAVEVLSVVSTQFKSILDAIREGRNTFSFPGEEVSLDSTVGVFITMNPGYLGRTELPESLKALFRPVTVVVPDLELICENMLMAEGFLDARRLAKKFITLYMLNKDLLSKCDHYDWGLRAIKAVLVVAGGLKRAEPDIDEEAILMRALRDFNKPKIVAEDDDIFMGLLSDLFPGLDLPRKQDLDFERVCREEIVGLGYQAEEGLVLKCVQLEELLFVRHCIFIIGQTGLGKTTLWKSLARTKTVLGQKTTVKDLNPKAITSNELYGYSNPATKEWKDGLLSTIMKDLGRQPDSNPKWIILDGDLDTEWIESMNSVMDDNKILTLANNDRIPLHDHMRLIFEIAHLKYATPATVSRAGIIYISHSDIGHTPFLISWLQQHIEHPEMRQCLKSLFEKYVDAVLGRLFKDFKHLVPLSDMNFCTTLCNLLDGLIPRIPEDLYYVGVEDEEGVEVQVFNRDLVEKFFVFCAVWAFGGACSSKDGIDYSVAFNKYWRAEWKNVKFPDVGTVFDYYIDTKSMEWKPWKNLMKPFVFDPDVAVSEMIVDMSESTCISYLIDVLADKGKPVMLVGNAGSGKTKLAQRKLQSLSEDYSSLTINFNYFTDAEGLQNVMESVLEKRGGKNFGPYGGKKLIYFIDDLNMSAVDKYGTQSPIALLCQHLEYQHWYDRAKLTLKDIRGVQYLGSMNPTAGSFTVNPRFQRYFATFAVSLPSKESLKYMLECVLDSHLKQDFQQQVVRISHQVVMASLVLHERVSNEFLKTAFKFHYEFNLRHLSNVYEGLLKSTPAAYTDPMKFVRLWVHESYRVYYDRLVEVADQESFHKLVEDVCVDQFRDTPKESILPDTSIYCPFAAGIGTDKVYNEIQSWETLNSLLVEALNDYNEENAKMDLVLFEDAMSHVCRVSRIIEQPQGNALLVGVGGSGKQSLSRLAAYISGYTIVQIVISRTYGISDLKEDLMKMYRMAGLKGEGVVFLFTDSQIVNERFLVYINDLLSSGNIPDLFPPEDKDEIINSLTNEAKAAGVVATKENVWEYFISKVRTNLHTCLCFSPVGDTFRVRARRFPALVNCTIIDWFFPWPQEALLSVADRFLREVDLGSGETHNKVVEFMAFAHESVNEASVDYRSNERRYNYTTPKSFLELIELYKTSLAKQRAKTLATIERLENGVVKLQKTSEDVASLEQKLKEQEVVVAEKKAAAEELLGTVAKEQEEVDAENAIAQEEAAKAAKIQTEVEAIQADAEEDLKRAEPAIRSAAAALDTLNKGNLSEMKAFANPPAEVKGVMDAVMILLSPKNAVTKDRSWPAAQKAMANVDRFLTQLQTFDKTDIPATHVKALEPFLSEPTNRGEFIKSKSVAAAGICEWVVNIIGYYRIHCEVEPKRQKLAKANRDLADANAKLEAIRRKLAALEAKVAALRAQFEAANSEKMKVEAEAAATNRKLNLAERLVNALASEKVRWKEGVATLKEELEKLVGDVLLSAAFLSYIGPFNLRLRKWLLESRWIPRLQELQIPMGENMDPIHMLVDDATVAEWSNEGLPADTVSVENGAIFTECLRWPLIIDPQLQGISWVKTREEQNNLKVIRLGQKNMLDVLERCIENGNPVLIENIGESVDAILGPVIGRKTIKKGHDLYVTLGDKEVLYSKNFRLFLHTKLSNPHYQPELQAETTLINFMVTEEGLEEQLLALVVRKERPELEQQKADLIQQQNDFKIRLKKLEANVLHKLSTAEGDILEDVELIENLEETKRTSLEIAEKVKEAKRTEIEINLAREEYRPVARRGSLLYFLLDSLSRIQSMYQFSLSAFDVVFSRAIDQSAAAEDLKERIHNLLDCTTYSVFNYARRGLFEKHKLIFSAQLAFRILIQENRVNREELDWLIRGSKVDTGSGNPLADWVSESSWTSLCALKQLEAFHKIVDDIEGSQKRWMEWASLDKPEVEKLPGEWKGASVFQRLMIIRALRPDRVTAAVEQFVEETLGTKYVDPLPYNLESTYFESSSSTPLFFILFPGADPVKDVENFGKKIGFTEENKKFVNVAMGQGQESTADAAMDRCARDGGWVFLQNIHLMMKWLPHLERKMELFAEGAHKDFRLMLSAEPQPPEVPPLPQGILQASIKIANEPSQTMRANMQRAWSNFNQDKLDSSMKPNEFKSILFALCFFHGLVLGRRKFGPQGWSRSYSFNNGDLTISADVLYNYLETATKIPWDDLKYIFGEIMYGGHITDHWDRRLCSSYLEVLMKDELFDGLQLAPGFPAPPPMGYDEYTDLINHGLPPESPALFGLPSNAEINFLSAEADFTFNTVMELSGATGGSGGESKESRVRAIVEDIMARIPDNPLDMLDINARVEMRTPYVLVCLQECERMNLLLGTMRLSLKELRMGLLGQLTISEAMDEVINALYLDRVPGSWAKVAYPSFKPLGLWFTDLLDRLQFLQEWSAEMTLPKSVWISGLFNPMSFLTAVMQTTARQNEWPLDKMILQTEVTKKEFEEITAPPRNNDGAYIHGLFLQGARWDKQTNQLRDASLKELFPPVPVIWVKAVPSDRKETKNVFECPVFVTTLRGATYVFTANLRTTERPVKWTLAGVAMLMSTE